MYQWKKSALALPQRRKKIKRGSAMAAPKSHFSFALNHISVFRIPFPLTTFLQMPDSVSKQERFRTLNPKFLSSKRP